MKLPEFIAHASFTAGQYEVCTPADGGLECLLTFTQTTDDEAESRHIAAASYPGSSNDLQKNEVLAALVRAGACHPAVRDEDLAKLHRAVLKEGYVELFADLNALKTGLLLHLITSLGRSVARVIISSSSIDVLHEYQSHWVADAPARLTRAGMVRSLRLLEKIREMTPVHIHQLKPGATRYFKRVKAQPAGSRNVEDGHEDSLYISEDRQMVGAFWDYYSRNNPRIPVFFVTSDFNLAHVCAAERAPFVFSQTPFEYWRSTNGPIPINTLWFDPFALAVRACLPHTLIWELCLTFGRVKIIRQNNLELNLSYNYRVQQPGEPEDVLLSNQEDPSPGTSEIAPRTIARASKPTERTIKLSLGKVIEVLPTRLDQQIFLRKFTLRDKDSLRQLRQIGELTGLYKVEGEAVIPGPSLAALLAALGAGNYIQVNGIFRRHPTYDRILRDAAVVNRFPSSNTAGAATGWAVMLGAAYKTRSGVFYGLADITEAKFEESVVRFHTEIGEGQAAAPLPNIVDRTCQALRLSPIRFEELLARSLGHGALADFETQRASVNAPIPSHPILVAPTSASSGSYLRTIEPGKGLVINRTLVGSLVRRPGRR
jgi:hypothetical protein